MSFQLFDLKFIQKSQYTAHRMLHTTTQTQIEKCIMMFVIQLCKVQITSVKKYIAFEL